MEDDGRSDEVNWGHSSTHLAAAAAHCQLRLPYQPASQPAVFAATPVCIVLVAHEAPPHTSIASIVVCCTAVGGFACLFFLSWYDVVDGLLCDVHPQASMALSATERLRHVRDQAGANNVALYSPTVYVRCACVPACQRASVPRC